jgi:polyhydroxybutyrate depolymerase
MKNIFIILATIFILVNTANAQLDTIYNKGEYRTFIVHEPTGYSPSNQYPLVLSLHGLSSSATFQQNYTQFDDVADSLGFIVVYPNGTSNSWTTIGNSDVDFLSSLVDSIRTEYSTNNCLFVTGFSQGGFMTYKFANNTPHAITAIAVGSGNMSFALQNASSSAPQIPIMHFHGTEDNIVSYDGTVLISPIDRTIQWWVNHNKCNTNPVFSNIKNSNLTDGSTIEKYYYGGGSNGSDVTFYKVINGGHTWSGATPIPAFGSTNQDINQSIIIGDFFDSFCSSTTGLSEEESNNSISLYPNPFNNQLTVQSLRNKELTFILYDNFSRQILKEIFYNNSTINTDFLPKGIYFYEIRNSKNQLMSGKVIKN